MTVIGNSSQFYVTSEPARFIRRFPSFLACGRLTLEQAIPAWHSPAHRSPTGVRTRHYPHSPSLKVECGYTYEVNKPHLILPCSWGMHGVCWQNYSIWIQDYRPVCRVLLWGRVVIDRDKIAAQYRTVIGIVHHSSRKTALRGVLRGELLSGEPCPIEGTLDPTEWLRSMNRDDTQLTREHGDNDYPRPYRTVMEYWRRRK